MKQRKQRRPKQKSFFPKPKREHGGSLSVGKRRSFRPLNPKLSLHITLKSEHAMGPRSLFRHKKMILSVMHKARSRFNVKVSEYAVAGNHLHLLIKGESREEIQNFFRVFAGHVAQNILKNCPLPITPGGAPQKSPSSSRGSQAAMEKKGCKKNQRKFWSYLIYSRLVTWGRELKAVRNYIKKNILETLNMIAYEPRLGVRKNRANSS